VNNVVRQIMKLFIKELMKLIKKILMGLLDVFINGPFVNYYRDNKYPLISDTAIEIANKIGWDKMYEKAKEAQKNGTSTINLKEYE
jgi:NAD(P)H-flavin reductase